MKKVMSVSVDELVIKMAKDASHELRMSFSAFVEEAIRARVDLAILDFTKKEKPISRSKSVADRIREKSGLSVVDSEMTIEDLSEAQAKLDAEKKSRNIKEEKIKKVREKQKNGITSLTGHTGSYLKGDQLSKKGKK